MDLLKRIDTILAEYKYWKKYGVFPEDDFVLIPTEKTIIRGGKANSPIITYQHGERKYPARYYNEYLNIIDLL